MSISPFKVNLFMLFKLPSAYLCGVRLQSLSETTTKVRVTHRWINQNPFKSMFWAVQGMAAEFSTGIMVMQKIRESGHNISMLVLNNKASFTKKARGRIVFTCADGAKIDDAIAKTVATGEGQTIWMQSVGVNKDGVEVSTFNFEWTLKLKA